MKSILLKTLAAASLVAAAQAEVHVLGVVWKERGLSAPDGTIELNPGTVAATRAYMIFDESIITAAPGPGTLILYRDARSGGVMSRTYTIDSEFRAFTADIITGSSGGRRIYGHLLAPATIADVPGATMPFSGTPFPDGYPSKLRLDDTVLQTGSVTGLTGPRIFNPDGSLLRSVLSGSASDINVDATTIADAVTELEARLVKGGYTRAAVVPDIVTDLPATLALQDGQVQTLSVGLGPNVFPAPTYKWFKDGVEVSTAATFNVVGGPTAAGTYRVEVTTDAGTAVSGNTVVSPLQYTLAALPATVPLVGANSTVMSVTLTPTPITAPTYQWFKGATAIPAGIGGTSPTLTVIGGEAATGAGVYRVEVTSTAGMVPSTNSTVTVGAVGTAFAFTANAPRTATPTSTGTVTLSPALNGAAVPSTGTATKRWFKAPLADPTNFTAIPNGDLGDQTTYAVTGNNAAVNGPGVYRLVVTSTVAPITTITSISTVVTTAP